MSNVRSTPLRDAAPATPAAPSPRPLPANRIVAVATWLVGALTTHLGLSALVPGLPWYYSAGFALVTQATLTLAERAMWRGRPTIVGAGALLIDVACNTGGIYPYARRLGETPAAVAIADVLHVARDIGPLGAIIAAGVLGFLIAAAPEDLWNRKD